jgi:hypothetical protein
VWMQATPKKHARAAAYSCSGPDAKTADTAIKEEPSHPRVQGRLSRLNGDSRG